MHATTLNPIIILCLECSIVFLAFLVRGFSGFAAGLIMTPLLAFFFDLKHAVVISVLLQLMGGGYLTHNAIKASNRKVLRVVMLPSCIACLIGVYALTAFVFKVLLLVLGIATLIFASRMFIAPLQHYLVKLERWPFSISTLIGITSGLLHGLYGAGGPPIVLFLSNEISTKTTLRATLLVYFLVLDLLLVTIYLLLPTVFGSKPLINLTVLQLGALLLIPTFIGARVGYLLQQRVSETGFLKGVALILIITAILHIQKGINQ